MSYLNSTPTSLELSFYFLSSFILKRYKNLNQDEITYISNFLVTLYSRNKLSYSNFLILLTYIDQSSICKYSILFNRLFFISIKLRDLDTITSLAINGHLNFIELYDNPLLSPEDFSFLTNHVYIISKSIEYVLLYINSYYNSERNFPSLSDLSSIYNSSFNIVCLSDSCSSTCSSIFLSHDHTPSSIYTIDFCKNSNNFSFFCFPTFDLVSSFCDNSCPINPSTGCPFSPLSINFIKNRLRKEILLYRRYLQLK